MIITYYLPQSTLILMETLVFFHFHMLLSLRLTGNDSRLDSDLNFPVVESNFAGAVQELKSGFAGLAQTLHSRKFRPVMYSLNTYNMFIECCCKIHVFNLFFYFLFLIFRNDGRFEFKHIIFNKLYFR